MNNQVSQRLLCPGCGSSMPGNDRYCGVCGARLSERAETELLADARTGATKSENLTANSTTSFQIGQVVEGRYRIVELIGRGGMASVFRVEQIHLKKKLAMKTLHENLVVHPAAVARFVREARVISKLENGHTVRLFDFGKLGDVFYLVMEYIEGQDLESLLQDVRRLEPGRALDILVQICESLEEAHAQGIVHRDLKPENIMLVKQKETGDADFVKVLDFGLAQMHEADEAVTQHSRAALFGTPHYMAPEQIRGEKIDGRTDLYALGTVGYRMLTGRCPFVARSTFDVLAQHLDGAVPSFAEVCPDAVVDPEFEKMILRCLAKLPDDRFISASSLRKSLISIRSGPGSSSVAVGPPEALGDDSAGTNPKVPPVVVLAASELPSSTKSPAFVETEHDDPGLADDEPISSALSRPWFSRVSRSYDEIVGDPSISDENGGVDEFGAPMLRSRITTQQQMWIAAGIAILVVGLVTIWAVGSFGERALDPRKEHEPNDSMEHATPATLDMEITGSLDGNREADEPDKDFFRVSGGGTLFDIYVDSTANVDFGLRVHGVPNRPVAEVNHRGAGHGEWVTRLRPPKGDYWGVEVYPRKQAGISDRGSYQLRIKSRQPVENEEYEPNGTHESATLVRLDESIAARTDGPFDADWFQIVDVPREPQLWKLVISGGGALVRNVRLFTSDLERQLEWEVGGDGQLSAVLPGHTTGIRYVEALCGRGQRCTGDYTLTIARSDKVKVAEIEPNNTFAESSAVVVGQWVAGSLVERDDVDVFRVPVRGVGRKFHVILQSDGARRIDLHVCGEGCTSPTVISLKQGRPAGLAEPVMYVAKEKDDALYVRISGDGSRRVEPYVLRAVPFYEGSP